MKKQNVNPAYSTPEMSLFRMDVSSLVCASLISGDAGQQ